MVGKEKFNILIISAFPPGRSSGLTQDVITALESENHNVDYFTLYGFHNQKSNQYSVYKETITSKLSYLTKQVPFKSILTSIRSLYIRYRVDKKKEDNINTVENKGWRIPHLYEETPPLNTNVLLEKLPDKKYDFIIIYITESMLTAPSYLAIYEKYRVPMIFECLDMIHFTGGCYFFGECKRFMIGCGKCPALNSENEYDQTRKNYLLKKDIFKKIQYAIICNEYQKQFALQCGLFEPKRIFNSMILIDEEKFIPLNMLQCRRILKIPSNKKFIILARYEGGILSRSKGYPQLVSIINTYSRRISKELKNDSLLLLIGKKDSQFEQQLELDTINIGRLDSKDLIKAYSAANVFISTSIDDAGPSMVNQSMMCGRPVITFSIGTALEVTKNGINGYMIPNFDTKRFSDAIIEIAQKDVIEYKQMCDEARKTAIKLNSKQSKVENIIKTFHFLKEMTIN